MYPDIDDEIIEQNRENLEKFFREYSKLPKTKVETVPPDEVDARGPAGGNISDNREKYEVFYRVEIRNPSKLEILETQSDVSKFLNEQLLEMEQTNQFNCPDSMITVIDNPPRHLKNKRLIFYIRSVL